MQTEVIFQRKSKGKGNLYFGRGNKALIRFNQGTYKTSNREEINDILNSELMQRNLIKCVTPLDIVDKWLRNEMPDSLTKDMLESVSVEGLIELAKIKNIDERRHANQPAVLRSMLKGMPVSNAVSFVVEKYKTEDTSTKDWVELAEDAGLIYRSGPWYKYRKGDEQDKADDLTLGKTEVEAQKWCLENEEELESRMKED